MFHSGGLLRPYAFMPRSHNQHGLSGVVDYFLRYAHEQASDAADVVRPHCYKVRMHFVGALHDFLRRIAFNRDLTVRKETLTCERRIGGSKNSIGLKPALDLAPSSRRRINRPLFQRSLDEQKRNLRG